MQWFIFSLLCLGFHCPIQFVLVSIAISSTFPFKLYFVDSCGLQDHFSPYQLLLCSLTCCPYLTAPNSINLVIDHPKCSGLQLQLSPRHLHIDVPLSSNATDWDSASCLSSQANACASPWLSPGLRLVLPWLGFLSFSLPMSHCFLETCIAYCQVPQTCSLHSPSLAEPLKLLLLQPLCTTSKMHTF